MLKYQSTNQFIIFVLMNSKNIGFLLVLTAVIVACGEKQNELYQPYTYNTVELDSLATLNLVLVDTTFSKDGSIREKKYYLGDTVKYAIKFNQGGSLVYRTKYEGPFEVWTEAYHQNGQRMSKFEVKTDSISGKSFKDGLYKAYYDNGMLQEVGVYKKGHPYWVVNFTRDGLQGDTVYYRIDNQSIK